MAPFKLIPGGFIQNDGIVKATAYNAVDSLLPRTGIFCNIMLYNGLRIDAAEGECVNRKGGCAAASVRVERSRIWKKKPGISGKKNTRTQNPPIKERTCKYFT